MHASIKFVQIISGAYELPEGWQRASDIQKGCTQHVLGEMFKALFPYLEHAADTDYSVQAILYQLIYLVCDSLQCGCSIGGSVDAFTIESAAGQGQLS